MSHLNHIIFRAKYSRKKTEQSLFGKTRDEGKGNRNMAQGKGERKREKGKNLIK